MSDPSEPVPEPANLRFLRRLVTTLTAVMICGLLVIVALLVIRFSAEPAPGSVKLPDHIKLPDGTNVDAFTMGRDWYAVVTADNRILVFSKKSGDLLQSIKVSAPNDKSRKTDGQSDQPQRTLKIALVCGSFRLPGSTLLCAHCFFR